MEFVVQDFEWPVHLLDASPFLLSIHDNLSDRTPAYVALLAPHLLEGWRRRKQWLGKSTTCKG